MRPRRRTILATLAALAAAGLGGASLLGRTGLRDFLAGRMRTEFGVDPDGDPEAAAFLAAFLEWVAGAQLMPSFRTVERRRLLRRLDPEQRRREAVLSAILVEQFLTATNWLRAQETGEPLRFVALADPYRNPCSNQLSAWA